MLSHSNSSGTAAPRTAHHQHSSLLLLGASGQRRRRWPNMVEQQQPSVVCFAHSTGEQGPSYSARPDPAAEAWARRNPAFPAVRGAPSGYTGPSSWASAGVSGPVGGGSSKAVAATSESKGEASLLTPDLMDKTATVRFHLKYKTSYGQAVKLLGSHPKLGNWNLKDAVELRWTAGDQWVANVLLPAGSVYEYKYVLVDYETKAALEWQTGSNAVLAVVVSETDVSVYDNWGNNPGAMVQVDEDKMTRETKLQKWANEMMGYWKEARRLQIELVHRNSESQGLRNELAQLRMELSLEKQGKQRAEQQVSELQLENAGLKAQLVQKTVELNNTLAEVLQLLDRELEGDEYVDEGEGLYMDEGEEESYGEEEEQEPVGRRYVQAEEQQQRSGGYGDMNGRRFGTGGFQAAGSMARSPALGSRTS